MTGYVAPGYFGSASVLTSTANKELIQQHRPSGWGANINAYWFSFDNVQDCTVKINGSGAIFIAAGEGFKIDPQFDPIYSFVIVEADITYRYQGSYR